MLKCLQHLVLHIPRKDDELDPIQRRPPPKIPFVSLKDNLSSSFPPHKAKGTRPHRRTGKASLQTIDGFNTFKVLYGAALEFRRPLDLVEKPTTGGAHDRIKQTR